MRTRSSQSPLNILCSQPSRFSVGVWLDTSYFTRNVRIAWGTLGGTCQIQAFELRVCCPGVTPREFIGRECLDNPPSSVVNFVDKTVREDAHICANFTIDIPPSLHPPYGRDSTYQLLASVAIITTDAMGSKSTITRTGIAEVDIASKHIPLFINPLTPSGPGPWSYTRC